jgi:RimJ/RimL family protein N-acetyltransferase
MGSSGDGRVSPVAAEGEGQGAEVVLKDGRRVLVRPAAAEDRPAVELMFRSCSAETLYTRFLSPGLGVPLRFLTRLMDHRPPRTLALIAEIKEEEKPRVLGLMNFVETEPPGRGEIAIIVQDDFQNRGLGRAMLRVLYDWSRAQGVTRFLADIEAGNRRVFHLIKRSGLPCTIGIDSGVAHAEVEMKAEIKL